MLIKKSTFLGSFLVFFSKIDIHSKLDIRSTSLINTIIFPKINFIKKLKIVSKDMQYKMIKRNDESYVLFLFFHSAIILLRVKTQLSIRIFTFILSG